MLTIKTKMKREISAGAVVFRKENRNILFLILHYASASSRSASSGKKDGHWDFVKGHIEEGESVEETIRREAEEETGIKDLNFIEGFKENIKYTFSWPPKDKLEEGQRAEAIFKIVTFRLASTKTEKVVLSFEHTGFVWLPYEEAIEKITYKNAKEILKKANEHIQGKSL